MNIVKFQDIIMKPEVLESLGYVVKEVITEEVHWTWTPSAPQSLTTGTVESFCENFNRDLRNKYAYTIQWIYILPMTWHGINIPVGDPFNPSSETNYVNAEMGNISTDGLFRFEDVRIWVDPVNTLNILQNDKIKYDYLNEFTPDNDITIDELKVFRTWLASILLANTPVINNWSDPDMLTTMLTYYKQNLNDDTVVTLTGFSKYMIDKVLVAGTSTPGYKVNLSSIGLTSGCGCFNSLQGVGNVATVSGCDPLQMYRNAIYNYMVETFSNVDYWMDQVEICVEMKKYLEGILKIGLPLGSRIIDPLAICECNTIDSDSQIRYRKMIEALIQSLTYIIEDKVTGNRNYVATSFSNWATYLYENMYWA